jgi:hypothetical protein
LLTSCFITNFCRSSTSDRLCLAVPDTMRDLYCTERCSSHRTLSRSRLQPLLLGTLSMYQWFRDEDRFHLVERVVSWRLYCYTPIAATSQGWFVPQLTLSYRRHLKDQENRCQVPSSACSSRKRSWHILKKTRNRFCSAAQFGTAQQA